MTTMSSPAVLRSADSRTRADRDRSIARALTVLSPRWHTWTLQTLAARPQGLRHTQLADSLEFVNSGSLYHVLTRLADAGLVARTGEPEQGRFRPYALTDVGRAALPVHTEAARWARTHVCEGQVLAHAEAAEIGFAQIMGANTLDVLAVIRQHGQAGVAELAAAQPYASRSAVTQRLRDTHLLGLVDRVGRGRYALSPAARDLDPLLEALVTFARARVPAVAAAPAAAPARAASTPRTNRAPTAAAASSRPSHVAAAPARSAHPASPPHSVLAAATAKPVRPIPAVVFSHRDLPRTASAAFPGRAR